MSSQCQSNQHGSACSRSSHRRGNADNRNQLLAKIRWEQLIHTTLKLVTALIQLVSITPAEFKWGGANQQLEIHNEQAHGQNISNLDLKFVFEAISACFLKHLQNKMYYSSTCWPLQKTGLSCFNTGFTFQTWKLPLSISIGLWWSFNQANLRTLN